MAVAHPPSSTDRELMRCVQADDTVAFGMLHARLSVRAHGVARRHCSDPDMVRDAVQDGFLSVWQARGQYRPEGGEVHSWIFAIVRNRAIDGTRRVARHAAQVPLDDVWHPAAPDDVAGEALAGDLAAQVRDGVLVLPDAQREVILLAFFCELTHAEIAARLGLPVGTVKSRIRLGLARMRRAGLDGQTAH